MRQAKDCILKFYGENEPDPKSSFFPNLQYPQMHYLEGSQMVPSMDHF